MEATGSREAMSLLFFPPGREVRIVDQFENVGVIWFHWIVNVWNVGGRRRRDMSDVIC